MHVLPRSAFVVTSLAQVESIGSVELHIIILGHLLDYPSELSGIFGTPPVVNCVGFADRLKKD